MAENDKRCPKCRETKSLAEFYKCKSRPSGYRCWCKTCLKQSHKRYYLAHQAEYKAYRKQYRQDHREEIAEYKQQYYNEHLETCRARARKYGQAHPDKRRARKHRYRTRKAQNGGSYSVEEWWQLLDFYGWQCLACGKPFDRNNPVSVDHIVPILHGGRSCIANLQPLCLLCNKSKGTKIIDYRDRLTETLVNQSSSDTGGYHA